MGTNIAVRDVVLFTPHGRVEGDVVFEDGGKILDVGTVSVGADEEVDGEGRWLWPGAIDGHVHFREPGPTHKEDFGSGSRAAVAGGVTTVFEMPNTQPTTTTLERLDEKRRMAESESFCNFGLFFGATPDNIEEARRVENVPGLKIFMGCSTGDLLVYREEDLDPIFEKFPGRICVHAESELRLRERSEQFADRDDPAVHSIIRDDETAAEAVRLACRLAVDREARLHVLHLSTLAELAEISAARGRAELEERDAHITCEVCPHHLFLNTEAYEQQGTFVRMNPPLRSENDRRGMWRALLDRRIQMVATDHAPHTVEEKSKPYRQAPSGVPGVETMLPLMLDAANRGECLPEDVLDWLCHGPADVYRLEKRGRIEVGHWADLVLIDPDMSREVRNEHQFTRCGWTPWHGRTLTGWPVVTWVNGHLAYRRIDHGVGNVQDTPKGTEVLFKAV